MVLIGTDSWQPLLEWLRQKPMAEGTIGGQDLSLLRLTDSPAEAAAFVADCCSGALARRLVLDKPRWYLGESGLEAPEAPALVRR